jgi:hypothetical protein
MVFCGATQRSDQVGRLRQEADGEQGRETEFRSCTERDYRHEGCTNSVPSCRRLIVFVQQPAESTFD